MDNKIILYKVRFSYSAVRQPYFTTLESRDTYFNTCPSLAVNKVGVNIEVGLDYIIDFTANIDVTVAQDYNFAVITYNNKQYYCNIIDCEHISVNRSAIKTKRNPLFEIISPFSYFENFNISEMSASVFSYNAYSSRILPKNLRFWSNKLDIYSDNIWDNTSDSPSKKLNYRSYAIDGNSFNDTPDWLFVPFLSVFVKSKGVDVTTVELYDQYSQSYLYLIPLFDVPYKVQYRDYNGTIVTSNGGLPIEANHSNVINLLHRISADIAAMQMVYIPCRVAAISNVANKAITLPFVTHGYYQDGSELLGYFKIASPRYKVSKKLDTLVYSYHEDVSSEDTCRHIFESLDIKLFSNNLSQHINFSDYTSSVFSAIGFTIEFEYIISDLGWSIRSTLRSEYSDSRMPTSITKCLLFPFIDKTSYNVTAEAKFVSENAYYNELTTSYRNQKMAQNVTQMGENIITGLTQAAQGANVLGASNLIRGGFNAINAALDDNFIEEQRNIAAANEKVRPSDYFAASNCQVFWREQDNEIWFFHNEVNENDFISYMQHLKYYGYPVNLVATYIGWQWLSERATDGKFIYLKFIASLSDVGTFQAKDYFELYKYFTEGHCYELF